MKNKRIWGALIVAFFLSGVILSYFVFQEYLNGEKDSDAVPSRNLPAVVEDVFTLRLFYPSGDRLEPIERRLPRRTNQTAIAESVIEEYFRGPEYGNASCIPENVKLLSLYAGSDHILYIDLSDELRRNFRCDALSEYLLLKGLYESLMSNIQNIQDVKIIVEGKELETLGGHVSLSNSLKNTISFEFRGDIPVTDE